MLRDALLAGLSLALGASGVLLEPRLHSSPFPWLEYVIFGAAWLAAGWNVVAAAGRNILRGRPFDESLLMTIATLGAFAVHALEEAVGVMLFFKLGELAQSAAIGRSRRSIWALLELRPDSARIRSPDGWRTVRPEEVPVGAEILVKPGERIPLDGTVVDGAALVNTAALTGEPVPRRVSPGSPALAGTVPLDGVLTVRAERPADQSSAARIIAMVEGASRAKAPTERLITRLARFYTPAVVAVAALIAFVPPLITPGARLGDWVYRALIMLVISCPCALMVSVPLGYFGGIGGAARRGILVKDAASLDTLAGLGTVVFDKTGTLTKGVFRVTRCVAADDFTCGELLGLAAAAEAHSNHPIAQSIREAQQAAATGEPPGSSESADHREIGGRGVAAVVAGRQVLAGNDLLMHDEGIAHDTCSVEGTVVHVAVDGRYAGYLVIADEPKDDAARGVAELRSLGVRRIAILTGDGADVAAALGRSLAVDEVHGDLLPEDKLAHLERIMAGNGRGPTAFVGDGINDAPVLARADVGIAMGRYGADAAVETADVVLMMDHPSLVAEAVRRGRRTRSIVVQNIALALGVKAAFLLLAALGVATMWEAVIADMGVALAAILNATRALR
ncbi:MAG: heavy metal translocating P-type ATPase [Spirochaetes bacterium]|nr:heavy metal translocating P-type ATPase [Spirochaetota bacterium]